MITDFTLCLSVPHNVFLVVTVVTGAVQDMSPKEDSWICSCQYNLGVAGV